jgi:hypothetical protein
VCDLRLRRRGRAPGGPHLPYDGPATNLVSNGLLLRADLHNLLDRGLLWIDDSYRVQLADGVAHYADHAGQHLRLPASAVDLPDKVLLRQHRNEAERVRFGG